MRLQIDDCHKVRTGDVNEICERKRPAPKKSNTFTGSTESSVRNERPTIVARGAQSTVRNKTVPLDATDRHPWHVGWEQCDTNRGRMSLGHPKPKNHQNITTNRNGTQQRTMRSFLSDPDALIDPTPAKIVPTLPDRYCLRRTSPNLKGTKSISATLINVLTNPIDQHARSRNVQNKIPSFLNVQSREKRRCGSRATYDVI